MPTTRSTLIDACVSKSASSKENLSDHISIACRDFLTKMHKETKHKLVVSADISAEWKIHASSFFVSWRALMADAGREQWVKNYKDNSLRDEIANVGLSSIDCDVALKDTHLIEAARSTDNAIVSVERDCRQIYNVIASKVPKLRDVEWINPALPEERPFEWLLYGGRDQSYRYLGAPQIDLPNKKKRQVKLKKS